MILAKVIGSVWSTRKDENLVGLKFLAVQPVNMLDESQQLQPFIAADYMGAGVGETVLVVSGSSARNALKNMSIPVDATIVGIVDGQELLGEEG